MPVDQSLAHLQELVRIETVVRPSEAETHWDQFDLFIDTLARLYPLAHQLLERELVDGHSLLFRWAGASSTDPTVLMAHYDVVPASDDGWTHPPFAATLTGTGDDRVLWGRGTLDDKAALACVLEAVEARLATNFTPANDIYLSFGHNEETTGDGALAIAEILRSRGVHPAFVLDEGGAVVEKVFPGVDAPIAIVGVGEKGSMNVRLTSTQHGGHSSTPPRLTAPVRLARAILRLSSRPFPARLTGVNITMIRTLGRHASGIYRVVFQNVAVAKPLVLFALSRSSDETNALTRTTAAVTMLSAGQAVNALAEVAEAQVNIRIAVGSSIRETMTHLRRAVGDSTVSISVDSAHEPSPVSPVSGPAWTTLERTISGIFPSAIVTPYLMLGATDSRHFTRVSPFVYRFSPFDMSRAERASLHAIDERIRVSSYLRGIEFYDALIGKL